MNIPSRLQLESQLLRNNPEQSDQEEEQKEKLIGQKIVKLSSWARAIYLLCFFWVMQVKEDFWRGKIFSF